MASITSVIPYTADKTTRSVFYCHSVSERLQVSLERCDAHALGAANRTLAHWLGVLTLTFREWEQGVEFSHIGFTCLSKYVCMYSFWDESGALFVPLPGQQATVTECEVTVDQSLLLELFELAKESPLLQGMQNQDPSALLSVPRTVRSPDYLLLNLNHTTLGQGIFEPWYIGYFRRTGEVWNSYQPSEGQYPDEAVLKSVKGIVLTGGSGTVYDTSVAWMVTFLSYLKQIYNQHPHIKFAAICLGAQAFAQALGGSVNLSKTNRFLLGIENVTMTEQFLQLFPEARRVYEIPENHHDEISVLPQGGVLYGSSNSCEVEVWGIENRVLAVQGHPNFGGYLMEDLVASLFLSLGMIDQKRHSELLEELSTHHNHGDEVAQLMEKFLKSKN